MKPLPHRPLQIVLATILTITFNSTAAPPADSPPRQTSGDTVSQPDWAEHLTISVGNSENATIRGTDEKAIQAAIDYVARLGGGTVKVLAGTYHLRNSVFLSSHIRLIGEGPKTILLKQPSVTTTLAADSDWFDQEITLADASSFQIGDGVCLRTKDPKTGVQTILKRTLIARTGNRFKIDEALRQNVWRLHGGTVSTLFPILTGQFIEDVTIENITLDGNRANNAELDGNYAGCIFLQDCNRIIIRNVHARNYNGDGISWQICHDVTVENCISEGHSGLGLHPGSGSQRPIIRNNTLRNNNIGLFICWGIKRGLAEQNTIDSNNVGISIGHHDNDNLITRNTITNSQTTGILFRPERGPDFAAHRNRIENNTLRNNGSTDTKSAAIDIQGGTQNIHITGNTIEDTRPTPTPTAIRLSPETQHITIENNTITGYHHTIEHQTSIAAPNKK